jgi:hypothetical protein
LEDLVFSEIRKAQKEKYYMFLFVHRI